MEKQIFRQKSMDRMSSPEQLDDYIRVSNPSVWMVLGAVIVLLVGVCVWGVLGRMETTVEAAALSGEDGAVVCYVRESDAASIQAGMKVRVGEETLAVAQVGREPAQVTADLGEYFLYVGGLQQGEWAYEVVLEGTLPQGTYAAEIVTEEVAPMSFVLN